MRMERLQFTEPSGRKKFYFQKNKRLKMVLLMEWEVKKEPFWRSWKFYLASLVFMW